jgi:cholinesterase
MARDQSEDCLFVNVWTKPQSGEKKKAVLFWVYGGAFLVGDSAFQAPIARLWQAFKISLLFRLTTESAYLAFLLLQLYLHKTQVFAISGWPLKVRDNIEKFGGDPERITVFGESAGALATDYYAYAYTKDPIVNGFLPSTGYALISLSGAKHEHGYAWYEVTKKRSCGSL